MGRVRRRLGIEGVRRRERGRDARIEINTLTYFNSRPAWHRRSSRCLVGTSRRRTGPLSQPRTERRGVGLFPHAEWSSENRSEPPSFPPQWRASTCPLQVPPRVAPSRLSSSPPAATTRSKGFAQRARCSPLREIGHRHLRKSHVRGRPIFGPYRDEGFGSQWSNALSAGTPAGCRLLRRTHVQFFGTWRHLVENYAIHRISLSRPCSRRSRAPISISGGGHRAAPGAPNMCSDFALLLLFLPFPSPSSLLLRPTSSPIDATALPSAA